MITRVALLTNFVAPYRVSLFEELQKRVDRLQIFVSTRMEPNRSWEPQTGKLKVIVQRTKTFFINRRHPLGFRQELFIHFPYDTFTQLLAYHPNVIISGEFGLRTLQAAIYRRFRRSARLIIWATLSEETERHWGLMRRLLRRFLLASADGVICNGRSGASYITSFGFDPARVFIVNQPVDPELFAVIAPARAPACARRLVYSGRLREQKGVRQLQHAIADWARAHPSEQVELLWIGDGEARADLQSAEVPKNFRQCFLGDMRYAAVPRFYAQAGALILPSFLDEWGLVINEAMLTGLVVIGSKLSQAVAELVTEDETGWTIDPRRPETIQLALDRFFATPAEKLAKMRIAARARALAISPEAAADRVSEAITEVLTERQPDGGSALRSTQGDSFSHIG